MICKMGGWGKPSKKRLFGRHWSANPLENPGSDPSVRFSSFYLCGHVGRAAYATKRTIDFGQPTSLSHPELCGEIGSSCALDLNLCYITPCLSAFVC
nr:PREDICTED: uncharacterized protein LOC108952344 isoform X3 [Musa acuminata subsp. malaccensis]